MKDYNSTINFYWSPLLVESNCDEIINHRIGSRIVRVKAIEKHARHWTDADILVFDSFAWWLEPKMTILPDGIYKQAEMKLRGYEMALNTWSDWLDIHINRTRTKMFFMGLSPHHSSYVNYFS
ncbi:trichome birefringence-like 34 [Olea europaea subsp. europaea]|uniref:Trichome birefringence-like 34 n=1 Tax=Olea europaea subsp. europaea TaxID=158383 RepID=A0A8S0QVP9_OLEEU|nr:trichome birefringence-like 34 [Olea europaea subsp. europaea]